MTRALASFDRETEAALLARVRGESSIDREAALQEIFRRLRAPVLALCLHLTADRAEAEDAMQEVFLSVHRSLPGFRGDSRLATWVYRISIRAALRMRARRLRAEPLEIDPPAREQRDPAIAREESERLFAAIASLPAQHRVVLALFALEGLSHRDIADTLGIPEGTVWSRLHTARKTLAEKLRG
jgi:RNA polymerase sigma-70 factor (ECF subfamily)